MEKVQYSHLSQSSTSTFPGTLVSLNGQSYLFIPHSSSFAGCYYTFQQEDPSVPIEYTGSSYWVFFVYVLLLLVPEKETCC